jgi:hypothetical protein
VEVESSDKASVSEEHVFGGGPPAYLYLPADWFDFLSDGPDADAAQQRYTALIERLFPNAPRKAQREIVNGLMLWRERLWTRGMLTHGIIDVPADGENRHMSWQIFVTAMKLPHTPPELDSSAILSRLVGQSDLSFATHVEAFKTDMGLGLGLFGRMPKVAPGGAPVPQRNGGSGGPQSGMAAALSYAPGAEHGIAVVGVSMDPEQDRELAMLVALIAGRSRFVTAEGQDT